ncbi:MAG: rRNA-processing protein las1 [Phylliscum demangeonii]|nr:MAG: rRNA-processing protein las1 [Phylliscum demangeonii]
MPQYIITPWRDLSELRLVRSQFYACLARSSPPTADERRQGVDTIRAWKFRGEVPHAVESTALLIDAAMTDDDALRCRAAISPWSVRAAYATAFARFVTGFVDASQTGRYKRSMYHVAQEIGLPTSFVELRHQIAHEEMPSVVVLRRAATRALEWLWEHFWRDIRDDDDPDGAMASGAGPDVEMDAVNERIRSEFRELLRQYVKQRIRDVAGKSKSKTKSSTTSHAETNLLDSDTGPLTAETSDNCLRKCHDNKHAMNLLGSVLLEIKFLVPANRA